MAYDCIKRTGGPEFSRPVKKAKQVINLREFRCDSYLTGIVFTSSFWYVRLIIAESIQTQVTIMPRNPDYEALQKRITQLEAENSRYKNIEAQLKKNLRFTESLLSAIPVAIFYKDSQGYYQGCNQVFAEIMGVSPEALRGKALYELWPTDQAKVYHQKDLELIANPSRQAYEFEVQDKNGVIRPVIFSKNVYYDHLGKVAGIVGAFIDISEQKQIEKALQESEAKYKSLANNLNVGLYRSIAGFGGRFVEANPAIVKMFGYDNKKQFLSVNVSDLYKNPADRKKFSEKIFKQGAVRNEELALKKKDGTVFVGSVSTVVVKDNNDQPKYFDGVIEDISDRKAAEQKLHDLYETMDLAQKMAGIGYWSYDIKTDKRMWSRQMYEQFGLNPTHGPPQMKDLRLVFYPEDWNIYQKNFKNALNGTSYDQVAKIIFSDGVTHFVHTQGYPRKNEAGDIVGLFGTSQDITAQVVQEKALRESEEKYRRIFENSVVGCFQSTPQGRFLSVNTAFAKMLNYQSSEELMAAITDIETQYYVDSNDRQRYQKILKANGCVENYEFKVKRKDGSQIWVSNSTRAYFDDNGQVVCYEGIVVDINYRKVAERERKALQLQLQQTQKFEAIATLAGGIAHDFNNLLMGIQGRVALIAVGLGEDYPLKEHIQSIEAYIQSAAHLTKQMLGLARGGKYEVKAIDINELVMATAAMFGRTRKEIRIHTKDSPATVVAEAEKKQLEQVLLNLFVNAWQAMPDGGDLFLETALVHLDHKICAPHQIEPGRFVKISVRDTGCGMDEITQQRIFDPFFTTKEKGRGTGLGLASAYGIVKNHSGMITVDSQTGAGATFNVYLPASEKTCQQEVRLNGKHIQGSETILLVDDEEMIIDVGKGMLERLGYRTIAAKGGEQAIETVRRKGNEIDLVLLDLIMPGMDGGKVFDHIRRLKPKMPVILSSGYALNGLSQKILNRGCNGFIQKPFNLSELSRKVREILDL
jgi:two-component system cell cycle sensor histidine kinase/response regulator CckA